MIRPWSDSCTSAIRPSSVASSTASPAARNSSHDSRRPRRSRLRNGNRLRSSAGDLGGEVAPEQAGLGEQHRDVGVTQEELELGQRGERRQRHRDRAGHRRAEERGHRLGPVAHQHADAGALAQPGGDQRLGHAPRLAAEVGVGPAHGLAAAQRVVEHERLVAREPGADLLDEPADRQRADALRVGERRSHQTCSSGRTLPNQPAPSPHAMSYVRSMPTPVPIPRTIGEVFDRVLATDPDRELLVTRSRRFSYAELDRLANRAAHALASLGVRAGDRVAGSLPNESDVVVAFHGAMRLGAVWVGVNRALAPPEKQYLLTDSGTSLLLCDEPTAEQLGDADGVQVVVIGPGEAGGVWEDAMVAADDAPVDVEVDPHAPAGIAYTSGTTGYPKGAVHSQYNLMMPGAVLVATRGYGPQLPQGRLPAAHDPQHAGAHHVADGPGRRLLGDHGPHRRAGRRRVDPRRAGHRVERAAGGDPLDGEHGRDRTERPRVAHRGVGRRRRLPRVDPQRVPAEVRDAAAHDLRAERGADDRHHRRSRRRARRRRERPGRCRTSTCGSSTTKCASAPRPAARGRARTT